VSESDTLEVSCTDNLEPMCCTAQHFECAHKEGGTMHTTTIQASHEVTRWASTEGVMLKWCWGRAWVCARTWGRAARHVEERGTMLIANCTSV
jgi:hypothetical protein